MEDRLIGKSGFYCRSRPDQRAGKCARFPFVAILAKERCTFLDKDWLT